MDAPNQEGQRRIKGPIGLLASGPVFAHIIWGRISPIRRTRVSISWYVRSSLGWRYIGLSVASLLPVKRNSDRFKAEQWYCGKKEAAVAGAKGESRRKAKTGSLEMV